MAALAAGLQGCGAGGTKMLSVDFDYPNYVANVWQPAAIDIRASGLEGYPAVCRLQAGDLPKGLAIESNGCRISGTATEVGIFQPTIRLTVPNASGEVDKQVRIVSQGPSADYVGLGGDAHVGAAYRFVTYGAESAAPPWTPLPGQTMRYTVTSGSLPHGLTLDAAGGAIAGVPNLRGVYTFTIQATATSGADAVGSPVRSYTLNVADSLIAVTYPDLTTKKVGDTLSIQPAIFYPSDTPAAQVSLGFALVPGDALPPGLSLDARTGVIAGTLTGPVPGQNPGQATAWPYAIRLVVSVTANGVGFTMQPYISLSVAP